MTFWTFVTPTRERLTCAVGRRAWTSSDAGRRTVIAGLRRYRFHIRANRGNRMYGGQWSELRAPNRQNGRAAKTAVQEKWSGPKARRLLSGPVRNRQQGGPPA